MATLSDLQRIRLMVGDVAQDLPYLDDNTYEWLMETKAGDNVMLRAAVEALEMIINQIALSPQSIKTEDITEIGPLVAALELRLNSLKAQRDAKDAVPKRMPIVVKSDRSDWNDFDELFGKCKKYVG